MTIAVAPDLLDALAVAWSEPHGNLPEDLDTVAQFFGIGRASDLMCRLTGTSAPSLSRAYHEGRVLRNADHISRLAQLVRALEELMVIRSGRSEPADRENLRRWLEDGCVLDQGTKRAPVDALADPDFVDRHYQVVRSEVGKGGAALR